MGARQQGGKIHPRDYGKDRGLTNKGLQTNKGFDVSKNTDSIINYRLSAWFVGAIVVSSVMSACISQVIFDNNIAIVKEQTILYCRFQSGLLGIVC